jgi:long-chain acyl-CoA synthetase
MDRLQAIQELTAAGQPYEIIPSAAWGRSIRVFAAAPPHLRALYEASRSDLPFLVYGAERLSFEEVWQQSCRIAHYLVADCGVVPGDRVAIGMRNYPEWVTTFMAATSIGAIGVAMNALWQPEEMAYGLRDSGAKVLFCDEERLKRLARQPDAFEQLQIVSVRAGEVGCIAANRLEEVLPDAPIDCMPEVEVDPNAPATIFYTSGSTGAPKGVVSSHRNILNALMSWELDAHVAAYRLGRTLPVADRQPATLLAVPLFHVTGSHAVFLSSYRQQRRMVAMYKWDVVEAAALIERERISTVVAPAAMTGDLVATALRSGHDLSSLNMVGGGGAPRAPEQVRGIDKAFKRAKPNTGWGMTETNAIGTGIAGREYLEHPESSGRVSALLDIRIVTESGQEAAAGERGELQVRGATVFRGYWNRPDADTETFDGEWMRTGDVAYLELEGYLVIVDRIKDLVIRGGENIGCGGVESALLEHPDVAEVSVYGVPDLRLGEEVGATVYATRPLREAELRDFLEPRLARFSIPRYFRFAKGPLPRTASGKILKRTLRAEAVAELPTTV